MKLNEEVPVYIVRQQEVERIAKKMYNFLLRKHLTLGEIMYIIEFMRYLNYINLDDTRRNIMMRHVRQKRLNDNVSGAYVV